MARSIVDMTRGCMVQTGNLSSRLKSRPSHHGSGKKWIPNGHVVCRVKVMDLEAATKWVKRAGANLERKTNALNALSSENVDVDEFYEAVELAEGEFERAQIAFARLHDKVEGFAPPDATEGREDDKDYSAAEKRAIRDVQTRKRLARAPLARSFFADGADHDYQEASDRIAARTIRRAPDNIDHDDDGVDFFGPSERSAARVAEEDRPNDAEVHIIETDFTELMYRLFRLSNQFINAKFNTKRRRRLMVDKLMGRLSHIQNDFNTMVTAVPSIRRKSLLIQASVERNNEAKSRRLKRSMVKVHRLEDAVLDYARDLRGAMFNFVLFDGDVLAATSDLQTLLESYVTLEAAWRREQRVVDERQSAVNAAAAATVARRDLARQRRRNTPKGSAKKAAVRRKTPKEVAEDHRRYLAMFEPLSDDEDGGAGAAGPAIRPPTPTGVAGKAPMFGGMMRVAEPPPRPRPRPRTPVEAPRRHGSIMGADSPPESNDTIMVSDSDDEFAGSMAAIAPRFMPRRRRRRRGTGGGGM
jgi:hypothetical protein